MEKNVQSIDVMSLQTKLIMFRTAYLQAVAATWADENVKKELVSDAQTAKNECINVLEKESFIKFLPKNFNLNWHSSVHIIDTGMTRYKPQDEKANDGWIGSNDAIIIKIPKAPVSIEDRPLALMSYYQVYSSLLGLGGVSTGTKASSFSEIIDVFKPFQVNFEAYEEAYKANRKNSLGDGGAENFYEFSASFIHCLAKCWEDEAYLNELVTNGTVEPLGEENSILKNDYADFHNPWGFIIKFEFSEEAEWDSVEKKWNKLPANQLYLSYPEKPDTDGLKMADAIARYNNTGPSYPFTCN